MEQPRVNAFGQPQNVAVLVRTVAPRRVGHADQDHQKTPDSPLEVRRLITDSLAEDAKCRHPGVTDGLYGLKDLAPFARLGHGIPMIRRVNYDGLPFAFSRADTDEEFLGRLTHFAPFLANFDLHAHGLRLAGGSVSAMLMRSVEDLEKDGESFHDFDLFLVGHDSDAAAQEAVRALGKHLNQQWGGSMEAYRTQNCITFYARDPQYPVQPPASGEDHDEDAGVHIDHGSRFGSLLVQVILRRYSTEGEVIHGFDMGSSAAMWDGRRVVLTGLGKIAAQHGANILNLPARRPSYERRLARYFMRGFDLVLPCLSDHALVALEGRLPYLYASGLKCGNCACSLTATALTATRPGCNNFGHRTGGSLLEAPEASETATSDYAPGTISYGNLRAIVSRNVRALGGDQVRVGSLCARAAYHEGVDIFAIEPLIDLEIVESIVTWCFAPSGKVNVKSLRCLLGPDRAMELMLEYMGSGKCPQKEAISRLCVERVLELNAHARIPFAFMRVEEKTALTGPFTRELVSEKDWYGEAGNFSL